MTVSRLQSRRFVAIAQKLIPKRRIDRCIQVAKKCHMSHVANVVQAGMVRYRQASSEGNADEVIVKRVDKAMTRAREVAFGTLRGKLPFLEAIGAVSPVLGLLHSKETALILALTITAPAVAFGVFFRSRIAAYEIEANYSAAEFLEYVEFYLGRVPRVSARNDAQRN